MIGVYCNEIKIFITAGNTIQLILYSVFSDNNSTKKKHGKTTQLKPEQ
jgi:hypothetical protein